MKLHSDNRSGQLSVSSVGADHVVIAGQRYTRSLLLVGNQVDATWGPDTFAGLNESHFAALAELTGHILLLGTGSRQHFPAPALLRPLIDAGLAVDAMDTGAACRTYNILAAEGRAVAAALIVESA
jgi:uncharacterized protein